MNDENTIPLYKDLPYVSTTIDISKTQTDIINILDKYGIKNQQWTVFNGNKILIFQYQSKIFRLELPKLKAWKKKRQGKIYVEMLVDVEEKITYRMFYWFIKSFLEISRSGIVKLDQLLLYWTMIQNESKNMTVGEVIHKNPNFLLSSPNNLFLPGES